MINHLHVLAMLVVVTAVAMGLLSLWVASSRLSRLTRLVILGFPLGCVVAIPAYEPFVFLLAQCTVVLGGMQAWKSITSRQQNDGRSAPWSSRFSLKSLMFLSVIIAALVAVTVRLPRHSTVVWFVILLAALVAGICTLLAVWVTYSKQGHWWRVSIATLVALLLAVPLVYMDGSLISFPDLMNYRAMYGATVANVVYATAWFAVVPGILVFTMLWLVLSFAARPNTVRKHDKQLNRRPIIKLLATMGLISLTLLFVLPLMASYLRLLPRPTIPKATVPTPNGYDDIVAAETLMVKSTVIENSDVAPAGELATELAKNARAFSRLREGLTKPCEKHLDYTSEEIAMDQFAAFRALARALVAEGRLAVIEKRYGDALDSYLDIVRLARCIERGGLVVDWLVAQAIESMGMYEIITLRTKLDKEDCDSLVRKLRNLEKNRESYEKARERDILWVESAYGWRGRLDHLLQTICYGSVGNSFAGNVELKNQTILRLAILELEIQTFERRHGLAPDRLEEVIPSDDWVNQDPYSAEGGNFIYTRTEYGHILYSVGVDRDDDGGRTTKGLWYREGDLALDSLFDDETTTTNIGENETTAE